MNGLTWLFFLSTVGCAFGWRIAVLDRRDLQRERDRRLTWERRDREGFPR